MGAVEDAEDKLLDDFLNEEANDEKLHNVLSTLIDRMQFAYLSLWAALMVTNGIIIGALFSKDYTENSFAYWCSKIIILLSIISTSYLIAANLNIVKNYDFIADNYRNGTAKNNKNKNYRQYQNKAIKLTGASLTLLIILMIQPTLVLLFSKICIALHRFCS